MSLEERVKACEDELQSMRLLREPKDLPEQPNNPKKAAAGKKNINFGKNFKCTLG